MDKQLIHDFNEALLDIKIFMRTDDLDIKAEVIYHLNELGFDNVADHLLSVIISDDVKDLLQTELIFTYEMEKCEEKKETIFQKIKRIFLSKMKFKLTH